MDRTRCVDHIRRQQSWTESDTLGWKRIGSRAPLTDDAACRLSSERIDHHSPPPPLDRRACRPIVIGYWPLSIDRSRMPRARSLLDPVSSKSRRFIRNRAPGETRPLSLPFRLSRSSFTHEIVLFGAVTTGRLDERVARFVEEETYGFIVEFE